MAHGSGVILQAVQQSGVPMRPYVGMAELALVAGRHTPTELHCHREHAIADAEHRNTQFVHGLRGAQVVFLVGAGVAARQDDPLELAAARVMMNPVVADITRNDFAEHVRLAHAARDELGYL